MVVKYCMKIFVVICISPFPGNLNKISALKNIGIHKDQLCPEDKHVFIYRIFLYIIHLRI